MILLIYAFWQHTVKRLRRARQLAHDRRVFNELPPYALRDLGVDRSEYGSYLAESTASFDEMSTAPKHTRRRLRTLG